jgi:hypothetical protein
MIQNISYFSSCDCSNFKSDSSYLILLAEESKSFYADIKQLSCDFVGAIFPQVIFNDQNYVTGMVVIELNRQNFHAQILPLEQTTPSNLNNHEDSTFFCFVDGLSPYIQTFLEFLYTEVPTSSKIVGGGAGMLTLTQEPVIFDINGIYQDVALILSSNNRITLGVQHGWESISHPLIATHTNKNQLISIDFKDAFSIYKEIVEAHSNKRFDNNNFFDIAKAYPIGIQKINSEFIVRDPITLEGESLVLVGEIDQNSVIHILHGTNDSLIEASHKAARAVASYDEQFHSTLIIDCISRVLFLDHDFHKEVQNISREFQQANTFGILTLGEIANVGDEFIEFYNKTCVIGAF